jgi:hypothetical protein
VWIWEVFTLHEGWIWLNTLSDCNVVHSGGALMVSFVTSLTVLITVYDPSETWPVARDNCCGSRWEYSSALKHCPGRRGVRQVFFSSRFIRNIRQIYGLLGSKLKINVCWWHSAKHRFSVIRAKNVCFSRVLLFATLRSRNVEACGVEFKKWNALLARECLPW